MMRDKTRMSRYAASVASEGGARADKVLGHRPRPGPRWAPGASVDVKLGQ
jgi:hypothetical protein